MKALKWILIAGIPFSIALSLVGIVMRIQHWPMANLFGPTGFLLVPVMLVLSWVFALRYKERTIEERFDSF